MPLRSRFFVLTALLAAPVLSLSGAPAASASDLPVAELARRIALRLQHDKDLVRRYVYLETRSTERRAADGSLRSRTTETHEVSTRDGLLVRRVIDPDTAADHGGGAPAARVDHDDRFDVERLLRCFVLSPAGREPLDGAPALKVAFTARPGCFTEDDRSARVLQGLAGFLWVAEDSFAVVRVRGTLATPVTIGYGLLGRIEAFELIIDRHEVAPNLFMATSFDYTARGNYLFRPFVLHSVKTRAGFTPAGSPAPPRAGFDASSVPAAGPPAGAMAGESAQDPLR